MRRVQLVRFPWANGERDSVCRIVAVWGRRSIEVNVYRIRGGLAVSWGRRVLYLAV